MRARAGGQLWKNYKMGQRAIVSSTQPPYASETKILTPFDVFPRRPLTAACKNCLQVRTPEAQATGVTFFPIRYGDIEAGHD